MRHAGIGGGWGEQSMVRLARTLGFAQSVVNLQDGVFGAVGQQNRNHKHPSSAPVIWGK